MPGPGRYVVPLSQAGDADPELIGGKARGFAVIARAGLPAPDGFVLTVDAHREAGPSGRLGDALAAALAEAVAALGDGPLAVRSSATGEDGAEDSHAGQYLTRLGVRGPDEAIDAVHACWASAGDARAAAYRAHRGHDAPVAMAVIVQRLASGEAAGVGMTCDPVTGDAGTVVVNAAWGLGELLVSGLVTPDDYRLARADGRLLRVDPGDQDVMLVHGAGGVAEVPVPPERRAVRVLDDDLLAEVHDGLLRCERALGRPADCEFSVVDRRVVWLQCRPMTALSVPATEGALP
ncbi:MAG: PEP/pyruvate-binding domain-containing protein [Thermoleophilia bacterium]